MIIAATLCVVAFGQSLRVTVGGAPAPIACGTYVQGFTAAVVPGGSGKIHIGTPALNTSNLNGTIAILFPNQGAASETLELGSIPVDLCQIYVYGEVPGETLLISADKMGSNSYGSTTFLYAGPVQRTSWYAVPLASTPTTADGVRIQVTPGGSGKVAVGTSAYPGHEWDGSLIGAVKVLWPNQGNAAQNNAWSERYQLMNTVDLSSVYVFPYVQTETPIAAAWTWSGSGSGQNGFAPSMGVNPVVPLSGGRIVLSSTPQPLPYQWVTSLRIRTIPGSNSKVYVGQSDMNTSTLVDVMKVITPNPNGGWSEEYEIVPNLSGASFDASTVYVAGTAGEIALYDMLLYTGGSAIVDTLLIGTTLQLNQSTPLPVFGGALGTHFSISAVPGGAGKIYIGSCQSMNVSTLAGVYAILMPASVIGLSSETFTFANGGANFAASQICAVPQVPGDYVSVRLGYNGLLSNTAQFTGGTTSTTASCSTCSYASVRAQVIPGQSGKVYFGDSTLNPSTLAGAFKVMWPNTGTYSVNEGHSEYSTRRIVPAGTMFDVSPAVSGEGVVYAVFKQ